MPQEIPVEVKVGSSGNGGYSIDVDRWAVVVMNKKDGTREEIVWSCNCPFAIRFETPGHFYNARPFGVAHNSKYVARSGPLQPGVGGGRVGPFRYAIDAYPLGTSDCVTLDPEYLVEHEGPP